MAKRRTTVWTDVFTDPAIRLRVMRIPAHGSSGSSQHSHAFHELVVIVDGHGKHGVGNEVYDIEAGDVFVILGDTSHGYPETARLSLINILYDPTHLGIPQADLGGLPGYHALFTIAPRMRRRQKFENWLQLSIDQLAQVTRLVAEMEEELNGRNRGYRFMATTHLMRLIAYLSRAYSQQELDQTRPVTQISELLGYMERHSAEPLTVTDLMGIANMSQTSLMRKFHEVLGRSPINYLIRLRIAKARQLLRGTDLPISDIAFEVGFSDSNYFARQFRHITGISPKECRGQVRPKRS